MSRDRARKSASSMTLLPVFLLVASITPAVEADTTRTYAIEPTRSQIRFEAVSRFVNAAGTFGRFGGEVQLDDARPESARARLEVEVASIDTRNRQRDDHLRSEDFFDAPRHPRATFVASEVRRDGERWVVSGQLTIRGITHALTLPVVVTPAGAGLRIQGEFTLSRRAFGVSYQSFLNPIQDGVRVWVDLAVAPK